MNPIMTYKAKAKITLKIEAEKLFMVEGKFAIDEASRLLDAKVRNYLSDGAACLDKDDFSYSFEIVDVIGMPKFNRET